MSDMFEVVNGQLNGLEEYVFDVFAPLSIRGDELELLEYRRQKSATSACLRLAPLACKFLKRQGPEVVTEYHIVQSGGGEYGHMFVSDLKPMAKPSPDDTVVDVTYRQFLDSSRQQELPNVFVGRRAEIMQIVADDSTARFNPAELYDNHTWVIARTSWD